jgi:cytoskeletal protein CcmA (bactofilin family)
MQIPKVHTKDQKEQRRRRFRNFDFGILIFDLSHRAKGSVYLHVLACSLLVSIIGLGSLLAVRVQVRSCRLTADYAQARTCAVSAVELGLLHIRQDAAWRTTWPNGTWMQDQPLGSGVFTLQGVDPQDNDLADSPYDAVVLTGIGTKGQTCHKTQVVLVPVIKPIEALTSCLQGSGSLHVTAGHSIPTTGAPVCTNGQLNNDGTIDGSAEAQSIGHSGTITGSLTVPGTVKRMPDADVISRYAAKATVIAYQATVEKIVLGPGCNPYGTADANGLYVMSTANANLLIRDCRIYGTLVVQAGTGTVTVDSSVLMQNYRSDFPTLLVSGNTIIKCTSATTQLSEVTLAMNFNPTGAPYNGGTDNDKKDTYPNEIQGLVHVEGSLRLQQTARIVGAVVCNGSITCEDTNTITYTPSLSACPPRWYTYADGMRLSPASWKQVVE